MIDRVRADCDAIGSRQLQEFRWRHGTGVRRRSRPDGPAFRDRVEGGFDLRYGERQQVTSNGVQVGAEVRSVQRDADSLTACREAEFAHGRRAGTQENGETIPPESGVATEQAARHEDGDGYALRGSDGKCVGQVVAVAIVERHDDPGSTRGNGEVVECRRFTSTHEFIEVGGKVVRAHAEPERVLDTFGNPVIAEDDGSASWHAAHAPIGNVACAGRDGHGCANSVSPPTLRPSVQSLTLTRRRMLCEQLSRAVSRTAEYRAEQVTAGRAIRSDCVSCRHRRGSHGALSSRASPGS